MSILPFRRIVTGTLLLLSAVCLFVSCATLSPSGVGRVKEYVVENEDIPPAFDGFKLAFVSDLHYPSLFSHKRLVKLVSCLKDLSPDILLLGGDYVTSADSIAPLFTALSSATPEYGIYAVPGNHDRRNLSQISAAMQDNGITLLQNRWQGVYKGVDTIFIAGVDDSFAVDTLSLSFASQFSSEAFVVLLAHTPDYAENNSTTADIVLSGHTHGGQVSLFGLYTPVKNTAYGTRFLRGRNRASSGADVITTNGVGTSRKPLRFWVPSEIVVVTLKCVQQP